MATVRAIPQPKRSAATTQDPTTVLYNAMYSAIAEKFNSILVNPQTPLQLQFPLLPSVANWAAGGFPGYDAFAVGDDCPLNHGLIYAPNASESVWNQYGLWVNGLLTPNRAQDPAYVKMATALGQLSTTISNQYNLLSNNFAQWKNSPNWDPTVTTVSQYIQSFYSGGLGVQYTQNVAQANGLSLQMKQYLAKADPVLSQAVASYQAPNSTTTYPTPPPVGNFTAGALVIGQGDNNLNTDLSNWLLGKFGEQGFGPIPLSMGSVPVFTQETVTVTVYEEDSYFFGLVSDSYSTSFTVTETITTYENFELDAQLSAVAAYDVVRASWLSLDALSEYKDAALAGGLDPSQFFDPQTGSLTLIPAFVVVGFNPTLKLTMATSAYNQYADAINNTGMKIGPFIVGGTSSPQQATVLSQDPNQTVVQFATPIGQLQNVQPYILGMVHFVTSTPSAGQAEGTENIHHRHGLSRGR